MASPYRRTSHLNEVLCEEGLPGDVADLVRQDFVRVEKAFDERVGVQGVRHSFFNYSHLVHLILRARGLSDTHRVRTVRSLYKQARLEDMWERLVAIDPAVAAPA